MDCSDAILVDATLNCLGILLRTRQSIANKIISAILKFNPLKQANSPLSTKTRIQIRSMEKSTRALLLHVYRKYVSCPNRSPHEMRICNLCRNPESPIATRIKQYVDRLTQNRIDIFDDGGSKKRALPHEPTDGLDSTKRRRLGAELPPNTGVPLAPNGPNSLAQLYTLTGDQTLASFDVKQLPQDLVVSISQGLLAHINQQELDQAINFVRSRFLSISSKPPQSSALGDDEEDYEPDFEPNEDREQILNRADALPPEDSAEAQAEVALGPFELPQPPPMTQKEREEVARGAINRVFGMIPVFDEPTSVKKAKPGLNRLAGSTYDREAWITFITRLATRAPAGLYDDGEEDVDSKALTPANGQPSQLGEVIRDSLWRYIMEDFRARIHVAISWLNEEWFNDKMQHQAFASRADQDDQSSPPKRYYETCVLKVLDGIMPYLDARDKLLMRFLSEIPEVSEQVLARVKSLAKDPERVDLAVRAILYVLHGPRHRFPDDHVKLTFMHSYLIMFKPPAREISVDAMEDLWRNCKAPARTQFPPPMSHSNEPPNR